MVTRVMVVTSLAGVVGRLELLELNQAAEMDTQIIGPLLSFPLKVRDGTSGAVIACTFLVCDSIIYV